MRPRICSRIRIDAESLRRSSVGGFRVFCGIAPSCTRRMTSRGACCCCTRTTTPFPRPRRSRTPSESGRLNDTSQKVEIDAEFLDLARTSDPEHEPRMATFLRERYAPRAARFDRRGGRSAAVSSSSTAIRLRLTIPVVFAGISPQTFASLHPPVRHDGHPFRHRAAPATTPWHWRKRLQPDARRCSSLPEAAARSPLAGYRPAGHRRPGPQAFETTYLFELSYDALIVEDCRACPAGLDRGAPDVSSRTRPASLSSRSKSARSADQAFSGADLFALLLSCSAMGVGRRIQRELSKSMGAAAADMALRDPLRQGSGRNSGAKQSRPILPGRLQGHAALGTERKNLPAGTTVLFKDPSIWDQHRNFVLAAIAVIALQSIFAGALLLERRSRRRTEASARGERGAHDVHRCRRECRPLAIQPADP